MNDKSISNFLNILLDARWLFNSTVKLNSCQPLPPAPPEIF